MTTIQDFSDNNKWKHSQCREIFAVFLMTGYLVWIWNFKRKSKKGPYFFPFDLWVHHAQSTSFKFLADLKILQSLMREEVFNYPPYFSTVLLTNFTDHKIARSARIWKQGALSKDNRSSNKTPQQIDSTQRRKERRQRGNSLFCSSFL